MPSYHLPAPDTYRRRVVDLLRATGPLHIKEIRRHIPTIRSDNHAGSLCGGLAKWPCYLLTRTDRGTYDLNPLFREWWQDE